MSNGFLPFAQSGTDADVMPQADYSASSDRADGHPIGPANRALFNKALKQSTVMSAAVGAMVDSLLTSVTITDDMTVSDLAALIAEAAAHATTANRYLLSDQMADPTNLLGSVPSAGNVYLTALYAAGLCSLTLRATNAVNLAIGSDTKLSATSSGVLVDDLTVTGTLTYDGEIVPASTALATSLTALRAVDKTIHTTALVTGYAADGDCPSRIFRQVSSGTENGITIIVATDGGIWEWIPPADGIDVRLGGVDVTGVTDSAPGVQRVADYISGAGAGIMRFPEGKFLFNSQVTVTNADFGCIGAGIELTQLISNNANGCILVNLTATKTASPNELEYRAHFRDLTCWPKVTRTSGTYGGSGAALSVQRVTRTLDHQSQNQTFENVQIRTSNETPWEIVGTSPQFDRGIYLTNASQTIIQNCFIDGPGCHGSDGIYVENSTGVTSSVGPYYGMRVVNTEVSGWRYGVKVTGWLEAFFMHNCEITSQLWGSVLLDATGTTLNGVAGCFSAVARITASHINGQSRGLNTRNWKEVEVDGVNFYSAWANADNASTQDMACVMIEQGAAGGGRDYQIKNSYFNNSVSADQSAIANNDAIRFPSGTADHISLDGNTFWWMSTGSGTASTNTRLVNLYGEYDLVSFFNNKCDGVDSVYGMAGLFYQSSGGYSQNIESGGNMFRNIYFPYWCIDVARLQINGGRIFSCPSGLPVFWQGSNRGRVEASVGFTFDGVSRTAMTGATPSVTDDPWGRYAVSNGSATTITNFTGGREGAVIDLLFIDGNTTVAHCANIFLQGSVSTTFATSTMLRLELVGDIWFEIGRRT